MQVRDMVLVFIAGEVAAISPAVITRVMIDPMGLADPLLAPTLCDVTVFPPCAAPYPLTVNVYGNRSAGGNAALDQHGFGFFTDDTPAPAATRTGAKPRA